MSAFSLLSPFCPSCVGGFLGYRGPLFGRELFGAGFAAFLASTLPKPSGQFAHLFGFWVLFIGHARMLA
jgi:hypothetical protein